MARKKMVFPCDLTKRCCEYGGSQNFNYGFMRGTEGACRHPKIDRRRRALYTFDGRPRFPCPLGYPVAATTSGEGEP
jgi:hypothetical protein